MGNQVGVGLYLLDILLGIHNEVVEEFCLQREYLLLGTEYLLLVFLQFLGDVSLGLSKSLLAYPLLRHLFLIGVSHLKVISEDIVISYFQTCYTSLFHFALLYLQEIVLTVIGNAAELVEFLVYTIINHPTLVDKLWSVGMEFAIYPVANKFA